ncbi:MAG: type II toxin-antitoxin system prevent-host-death family antitoxin [Aquiluna sp.]
MENMVGIRELKQNASAVVKRAKEGEVITITERGVPVAKLLPIPQDKYLELIQDGTITPARGQFDFDSIVPIKLPDGITSEQLISEMREDRV